MASNRTDEKVFEYSLRNASDRDVESVLEKLDQKVSYHRVVLSTNKLTRIAKVLKNPQFHLITHLNLWDNQITSIAIDSIPRNLKELDLGQNKIEHVPCLADFENLRKLSLSKNHITNFSKDSVPPHVEILDLSGNEGLILPELNEHVKLRELYLIGCQLHEFNSEHCPVNLRVLFLDKNNLGYVVNVIFAQNLKRLYQRHNGIKEMKIEHLPRGLEFLNLENNFIEEVGNMKDFTSLKELKVRHNRITTFKGVPMSLTDMTLKFNPVKILGKECFSSATIYNVWKNNLTVEQRVNLQQPPEKIFTLGYEPLVRYYGALEDDKFGDGDMTVYQAASSSKRNRSFERQPSEEYVRCGDVVPEADLGENLTDSTNRLVLVGGPGAGKTSLTQTLVEKKSVLTDEIKDRTKVVNVQTLKLTNQDTFKVFDQGGHEIYTITNTLFVSKKSTVFVCHDVTQCDEQSVEATMAIFKRTLQQQPQNDINLVLTHSDMLETRALESNKDDLVSKVHKYLQEEVDTMEKLKSSTSVTSEESTEANNVQSMYQKVKSSMKVFVVSSKSLVGIGQVTQFLTERAASNRVVIPSKWMKLYEKLTEKDENFLLTKDVEKTYLHFFSRFEIAFKGKDKFVIQGKDCLRYFHDIGSVLWFEDHPILKNYVFNNIEFLIKVFRAILNHEFPTTLVYKDDKALQEAFMEAEYQSILRQYQSEGLLPQSMLQFLWKKHNLGKEDINALLELMKSFDICYQILSLEESKLQDPLYFFPWFVRSKTIPVNFNIAEPMIVDNDTMSLMFECVFHNSIPVNVCEILCVRLQKHAVKHHYHGQRLAWKGGLMVTLNRTECFIFRNDAKSTISCCIRCPVEDMADAWKALRYVNEELVTVLAQWYGIIRSIHMVCSHCNFRCILPPHRWPAREVWLADLGATHVRCPKQPGENIPAALILPIATTKKIKAAVKYMKTQWTNAPVGEPLAPVTKAKIRTLQAPFLATVNTQPVIDKLFVNATITDVQKQEVNALATDNAKAHYLYEKVLLRGTGQTLDKFLGALSQTGYHTNVELAGLLTAEIESKTTPLSYDAEDGKSPLALTFLTSDELSHMRKQFYQSFVDGVDVEALVPHLVQDGTLDRYQEDQLHGQRTVTEKARYLMDCVLFRGNYQTVTRFRNALQATEQSDLATLLPMRAT